MQKVTGLALQAVTTTKQMLSRAGCFSGGVQESREDQPRGFGAVSCKGYDGPGRKSIPFQHNYGHAIHVFREHMQLWVD